MALLQTLLGKQLL